MGNEFSFSTIMGEMLSIHHLSLTVPRGSGNCQKIIRFPSLAHQRERIVGAATADT